MMKTAYLFLSILCGCGALSTSPGPPSTPATPPLPFCHSYPDFVVTDFKEAGIGGSYPREKIQRAIRAQPGLRRLIREALKDMCNCFKGGQPASVKSTNTAMETSPPFNPGIFVETCPASTKYVTFWRSIVSFGEKCWILHQWHGYKCPYKECRIYKCNGVKPTNSPFHTECRHTDIQCKAYYVWCPMSGKIYRRHVCLPHSCSCMYLKCLH